MFVLIQNVSGSLNCISLVQPKYTHMVSVTTPASGLRRAVTDTTPGFGKQRAVTDTWSRVVAFTFLKRDLH